MKKYVFVTAIMLFSTLTNACINSYVIDFEGTTLDPETIQLKKKKLIAQKPTPEILNDLAVLQIYEHNYDEAIETFKKIEKIKPNLAKTAANLGTAYELNGDLDKAYYWINKGIERDPKIHNGSEWIHLKIIDAKKAQNVNPDWTQYHDVLGLDFGDQAMPYAHVKTIKNGVQEYDLATILSHSIEQMQQRLHFVKYGEKDLISAQIVMNIANMEMMNYTNDERTQELVFNKARDLGYQNIALLNKRRDYFFNSKWYALKRWMVLKSNDLVSQLKWRIAEIKQKYL